MDGKLPHSPMLLWGCLSQLRKHVVAWAVRGETAVDEGRKGGEVRPEVGAEGATKEGGWDGLGGGPEQTCDFQEGETPGARGWKECGNRGEFSGLVVPLILNSV